MAHTQTDNDGDFQGGSRPVKNDGQDTPNRAGRSAGGIVVGILSALALLAAVFWFGGRIAGLQDFVGGGTSTALWVGFAIFSLAVVWYAVKVLRRST